jgi:[acyl-carrier-protein] S-malonyltransferase
MINVVFSGQGAQFVGMGLDFYNSNDMCRDLFDKANTQLGYAITDICFNGPEQALNQTQHTQVAIFIISACIFEVIRPSISISSIAGHSLGEITAYYAAGVLDFNSALQIVIKRGELMGQAAKENPGKMAAIIGLSDNEISNALSTISDVGIANYNSPVQYVISGAASSVDSAMGALRDAGAGRVIELPVSGAFHSPLMKHAVAPFQTFLDNFEFKSATVPIVLNRSAKPEQNAAALKQNLSEQIQSPVRWVETIEFLSQQSLSFVEVGPGKVLSGLIKKINRQASVQFTSTVENVDANFGLKTNDV